MATLWVMAIQHDCGGLALNVEPIVAVRVVDLHRFLKDFLCLGHIGALLEF